MTMFLAFGIIKETIVATFGKRISAIYFLLLIAILTGCSNAAHVDWDYIIPNNYYGFLVIHYECPSGQPLVIQNGKIRIEFNDDGTLCIKDRFLASTGQIFARSKAGQPIALYELTPNEQEYVFHDAGVRGIGKYGVDYGTFEIFWAGIKKDETLEGLDDFLEKHFGVPKFRLNSTPTLFRTLPAK